MTDDDESNDDDDDDESNDDDDSPKHLALLWLFRRLSGIARMSRTPQRKLSIFKFFAAAALQLGSEAIVPLLAPILHALHITIEDEKQKGGRRAKRRLRTDQSTPAALAKEVLNLLQSHCDTLTFAEAYNSVQQVIYFVTSRRKQVISLV